MKKNFYFVMFMLAIFMQSSTVLAEDTLTPVFLHEKVDPMVGGNQGPTRSPETNIEPTITAYLSESSDSLLLYSSTEETITYYIYDEDEQEVTSGSLVITEQSGATIYLGLLGEGTYTICIVVDGITFEGEFEL